MDVDCRGPMGLDGVASVCVNLVLLWAKVPLLTIGVELVIIFSRGQRVERVMT